VYGYHRNRARERAVFVDGAGERTAIIVVATQGAAALFEREDVVLIETRRITVVCQRPLASHARAVGGLVRRAVLGRVGLGVRVGAGIAVGVHVRIRVVVVVTVRAAGRRETEQDRDHRHHPELLHCQSLLRLWRILLSRLFGGFFCFKHGSFRVWGYTAQAKKRYLRPFAQALKHLLIYLIFKVLSRNVNLPNREFLCYNKIIQSLRKSSQTIFTYPFPMANFEEQDFQNELRQAQVASSNQPDEEAPEEELDEEPETLESPEDEQVAQASLSGKKAQAAAEKKIGQGIQKAGEVGKGASFLLRRIGGILISFGAGAGISIIGLIFGLPLLLIGIVIVIIGIFSSMASQATIMAGEAMEKKAKKEEKKIAKAGGGGGKGMLDVSEKAAEAAKVAKKASGFLAGVFISIGCSFLGLFSGFLFIAAIVMFIVS